MIDNDRFDVWPAGPALDQDQRGRWGDFGSGAGGYWNEPWLTGAYATGYWNEPWRPAHYGVGPWNEPASGPPNEPWRRGWGYGASGRYAGVGPRDYQRSDERIDDDVNARLTWSPDLDASDITVRVDNGVVTLSGSVDRRWQKRLAEDIAEDVFGVRDVFNELHVRNRAGRDQERTAAAGASR